MRFVGIEYDIPNTSNHTKGYLRIPDSMPPGWFIGYEDYLKKEKKVVSKIHIYPLNIKLDSDTMGSAITGYDNLEDEFNLALRSNKYFPRCEETDAIRRAWSMMDPVSPDYAPKER